MQMFNVGDTLLCFNTAKNGWAIGLVESCDVGLRCSAYGKFN